MRLIVLFAAAVEEFEEAEENPGEEEDDGKKDADEEVEVEHVDARPYRGLGSIAR